MSDNQNSGIFHRVWKEVNKLGVFISIVGAGILAHLRLPVVSAVFVGCAIWFIWALRRDPMHSLQQDTEQIGEQ